MPILDLKQPETQKCSLGVDRKRSHWETSISGPGSGKGYPIWVTKSRRHPVMLLCHPFFFWPQPPGNTVVTVVTVTQWWRFSQQSRCPSLSLSLTRACDPRIGQTCSPPPQISFLSVTLGREAAGIWKCQVDHGEVGAQERNPITVCMNSRPHFWAVYIWIWS